MSGRSSGPERPTPAPLTDSELDRIPVAELTASAKANYRIRRRKARGGRESFVGTDTLAREMGHVSEATARRSTRELVDKGYLEDTGRHRNKRPVYLLCRGPTLKSARGPCTDERYIEEGGKNPSGFQPERGSSNQAAASPMAGGAGSAAAKRRTGWRFAHGETGGTYVRDPNGTDKPPTGYFTPPDVPLASAFLVEELPDTGPEEERQRRAAEIREQVFAMFGGPRPGERLEAGRCDDCKRDVEVRERFGRAEVCLDCLRKRHAATIVVQRDYVGTPAPIWTGWRRDGDAYVRDVAGVDHPPTRQRKRRATAAWEFWRKEEAA